MTQKEKSIKIIELLDKEYGDKKHCFLMHEDAWQLLVATILSAQCTDERVNAITPELFRRFPDAESTAMADVKEIEELVKTAGLYKSKAANIKKAALRLTEVYGGIVPSEIEELTTLAGVGRKTANVVRTHIFNIPSVTVDTHVKRLAGRFGLTKSEDPVVIEQELMRCTPREMWSDINYLYISHGRNVCTARNPKCVQCTVRELCKAAK